MATIQILIKGSDHASGAISGVSSSLGRLGDIVGGILGANLIMRLGESIVNLGREAFEATASYERLSMAIETMTAREAIHSGAAANLAEALKMTASQSKETLQWIQTLAIKSPFDVEGVTTAFRMAQTFGFTSDEAKRLTENLANMSAGMGLTSYDMQHVAYALGQINSADKLLTQDLRQLMNAGVPVRDILASMGMTMADLQDETKNANGANKKFVEQFLQMSERDFPNAAERMATSWGGLANSISDIKSIGLREFFSSTFDAIRPMVVEFVDLFTKPEFIAQLREWGKGVGEFAKKINDLVLGALRFFGLIEKNKNTEIEARFKIKNEGGSMSGVTKGIAASMTDALKSVGAVAGAAISGVIATTIGGSLASGLPVVFSLLAPKVGGWFAKIFTQNAIFDAIFKLSPAVANAFISIFSSGGVLSSVGAAISAAFGAISSFAAPILSVIAPIASGFMTIVIPLLAIVAAAMLVYGAFELWKSGKLATLLEPLRGGIEKLMAVFNQMQPVLLSAWNTISSAFQGGATTIATQVIDFLVEKFNLIVAWVSENRPLIENFVTALANFFANVIVPAAVGLWSVVSPILGGLIDLVLGLVKIVMQVLTGDFKGAWETAKETVFNVALAIWNALKNLWNWIVGIFQSLYNTLVGHSIVPDMMNAIYQTIINGIMSVIVGIAAWVMQFVQYFYNLYVAVQAAINMLVNAVITIVAAWMSNLVQKVVEGITQFIQEFLNAKDRASNAIKTLVDAVINRAGNLSSSFSAIGEQMVQGMVSAIYNGIGAVADAVWDLVDGAISAAQRAAQTSSPSKRTRWIGEMMVAGLEEPFKEMEGFNAQTAGAVNSIIGGRGGVSGGVSGGGQTVVLNNYGTVSLGNNGGRFGNALRGLR